MNKAIVVCTPCSEHAVPIQGSLQRCCAACGQSVWVAASSLALVKVGAALYCHDCYERAMQKIPLQQQTFIITAAQMQELRRHFSPERN